MTHGGKNSPVTSSAGKERLQKSGVVTFLDVLGWKGIYNRETAPITKLSTIVSDIQQETSRFRGLPYTPEIRSISDTIVIYTRDVESRDLNAAVDAHGYICAGAIVASILARIPVRGATSFGDFEAQDNIYVGKAIDEAASWYEAGDWIGVHLTPSAMYAVGPELKNWSEYHPPLKNGTKHRTLCVDWVPTWAKAVLGGDPKKEIQSVFRDMGPITPDFAMKFVNTLNYFDEMQNLDAASDGLTAC